MTDPSVPPPAPRVSRRQALFTMLAAAGAVSLPGCGGGGIAGVDTGGTGSFSSGRISGFGSIIVNGVRFDDSTARIALEDDPAGELQPRDLKLGMVVRVEAGEITPGSGTALPSAKAASITIETQVKGPVDSKTAPDTLVVLGQTVKVTASTIFAGTTFAGIVVGDILEVSGFVAANGVVTASRIEREDAAGEFKVRGVIEGLDTSAKTFRIGTVVFDYSDPAARLPGTPLANGLFVRVRVRTTKNADGEYVVVRIDLRDEVEDRAEAEVEGILVRNGTLLQIDGLTIDVSKLAGITLPIGLRVEVKGEIVNGVLVATSIEIEDENEEAEVDVRGTVSSVNTSAQTFVVRGVTFHYDSATGEKDGTITADLKDGATVRVRGTVVQGSLAITATEIEFDV